MGFLQDVKRRTSKKKTPAPYQASHSTKDPDFVPGSTAGEQQSKSQPVFVPGSTAGEQQSKAPLPFAPGRDRAGYSSAPVSEVKEATLNEKIGLRTQEGVGGAAAGFVQGFSEGGIGAGILGTKKDQLAGNPQDTRTQFEQLGALTRITSDLALINAVNIAAEGGVNHIVTDVIAGKQTPMKFIGAEAGRIGPSLNTATARLAVNILKKTLSAKAFKWVITSLAIYAGGVGAGWWGQAESPEAYTFVTTSKLIPEAERTGDWSLVDESLEAALEAANPNTQKTIALWSPFSFVTGASSKSENIRHGVDILMRYVADRKEAIANGTDGVTFWDGRMKDEEADQIQVTNNATQERETTQKELDLLKRQQIEWENAQFEASRERERKNQMRYLKERESFLLGQQKLSYEREEKERLKVAQFWLDYRKKAAEINEANAPSALNFGLI